MPRNIWADNPLPFYPTNFQLENMEEVKEERRKRFEEWSNLPIGGLFNRNAAANMAEHTNKGKSYRGFLDYTQASAESFAEDYTRGIFAQNTANIKYVADRISSIFGEDKYTGTILDLNEQTRGYLQEGTELSGWNIVDQWSGISHGGEDITDMMAGPAPAGWNPKDAVDVLLERDPERANFLLRRLGSIETLYSLTENARTPSQFFYMLGDSVRKKEIGQSIEDFGERHGTLYWTADWVKNLLVNGVLNDPDLATSTGISLLLGVLTGSTSLLASAVYQSTKVISKTKKVLRMTRALQRAQNYLPETIGPHLLRKYVWKEGYARGTGVSGFFVRGFKNVPGNIAEGALTGFAAEVRNQYRKMYMHDQKELDWGRIGMETLFEAVISPAINPVVGWGYKGIGFGGGLPLSAMGYGLRARAKAGGTLAKNILSISNRSKIFLRAETADGYLNQLEAFESVRGNLEELLVEGSDPLSFGESLSSESRSLSLAVIFDEMGISPDHSAEILAEILQDIEPNDAGYSTDELLSLVVERLSESEHTGRISPDKRDSIMLRVNYTTLIEQIAKTEEISLEEAADVLAEKPELTLPPEMQNKFEESKEEDWDNKTQDEKFKVVNEFVEKEANESDNARQRSFLNFIAVIGEIKETTQTDAERLAELEAGEDVGKTDEGIEEKTARVQANLETIRKQLDSETQELNEAYYNLDTDQDSERAEISTEIEERAEEISKLDDLSAQLQSAFDEMKNLTSFVTKAELEMIQSLQTELKALEKEIKENDKPEWKAQRENQRRLERIAFLIARRVQQQANKKGKPITLNEDLKRDLGRMIKFAERIGVDAKKLKGILNQKSVQGSKLNRLINTIIKAHSSKIKKAFSGEDRLAFEKLLKDRKKKYREYQNYTSAISIRQKRVHGRNIKRARDGILGLAHRKEVKKRMDTLKSAFEAEVKAKTDAAGSEDVLLKSKERATKVFKDSKKKIQKLLKEDPERRATGGHKAEAGTAIWRAEKRLKEQQEFFGKEQKQELEALIQKLKDQNPSIIIEDPTGQQQSSVGGGELGVDVTVWEDTISIQEGLDRGLITQEAVDTQRRNNQQVATFRNKEVEPDDFEIIIISRVEKPLVRDNGRRIQNARVRLQEIHDIPDTRETPLPTEAPPKTATAEATVTEQAEVTFTMDEMMRTRQETRGGTEITMGGWVAPSSSHSMGYFNILKGMTGENLSRIQNEVLTVDRARDILEASHEEVINRSKLETPTDPMAVIGILESLRSKHQIPMPSKDFEAVMDSSTPGTPFRPWASEVEELNTWNKALVLLKELYTSEHTTEEDGEHFVAEGQLAEIRHSVKGLNDAGLGWRVFAETAILGTPTSEEIHTYNLKTVITLVQREVARASNKLRGWVGEATQALGEEIENHIRNDVDTLNLVIVQNYIRSLRKSLEPMLVVNYTVHGFPSDVDPTGKITFQEDAHNESIFIKTAIGAMANRIDTIITSLSGHQDLNKLNKIRWRIGLDPVEIIDVVATVQDIVNNLHTLAPPGEQGDWTIENFGNGKLDWAPARDVGYGIIDVLADKDLSIHRSLTSVEGQNESHRDETGAGEGDISVRVTTPGPGESHRASITPLAKLAEMENRERFYLRAKEVFDLEITEDTREAIEEWIKESNLFEGTPNPLGAIFGAGIAPEPVGGALDQTVPTMSQLHSLLLDLLFNMPNLGVSLIYDQITGSRDAGIMFNSQWDHGSTLLTQGDDVDLPWNRIGETFAMEMMGPSLHGLVETVLDYHNEQYMEWRKEHQDGDMGEIYSEANHVDRNASFRHEWKLNSLALVPGAMDRVVQRLTEANEVEFTKAIEEHGLLGAVLRETATDAQLEDIYGAGLLNLKTAIETLRTNGSQIANELGIIAEAMRNLEGITTVEQIKTSEDPVVKALRAVMKVPIMRTGYEAGQENFKKEFFTPKGKGYEAMQALYKAMDQEFTAPPQETLASLEKVLFNLNVTQLGIALSESYNRNELRTMNLITATTGVTADLRNTVLKLLGTDDRTALHRADITKMMKRWNEVQTARKEMSPKSEEDTIEINRRTDSGASKSKETLERNTGQPEGPDPDFTPTIVRVGELRKLWEANMEKAAQLAFRRRRKDGTVDEEAIIREHKNRYKKQYKETEELFKKIEARKNNMIVTEQDIQSLKDIWGMKMPQIQDASFRALNMLGASSHRLNQKRATAVAESLGLSGVDIEENMGYLNGHNLYLGVGTSPMSGRTYEAHSSKFNTTGMAIDRVATVLEGVEYNGTKITSYEQYFDIRRGEHEINGDEWNADAKSKVLQEYLEFKGANDTLGIFDTVDNPYHKMEIDQAEQEIENILYKQILLWWASHGRLPKSVFPNYTAEDSDELFHEAFAMKWLDSQFRMGDELGIEMALEKTLGPEALELKSQFGLWSRSLAEQFDKAPRIYTNQEQENPFFIENSQQRGVLALLPQYARSAFTDRGIFALQEIVVEKKLRDILGDFYEATSETHVENPNIWGWASAYEGSRFAPKQRTIVDYLARFDETPEQNMFAARTAEELDNWVQRVYGDNAVAELYKNPSKMYPYYWLTKELSKINEEFTRFSKANPTEEELSTRRSKYLEKIHLLSKVQRHMKNWLHSGIILERPDQPFAITKLIDADETYGDVFSDHTLVPMPNQQEIDFGTVLHEGTVMVETTEEQAELQADIASGKTLENYVVKAGTGTAARIPQGRDSFSYLGGLLVGEYTSQVLRDFEIDGEKPYANRGEEWLKDPTRWSRDLLLEHRPLIWNQVRKLALSGEQTPLQLTFDITKVENQDHSHELSLEQLLPTTVERGGQQIPMASSHPLSELGFTYRVLMPRNYTLISGKFKLALTPAAVVDMFSIIDNHHVRHSIHMAAAAGKIFGVKRGPEGTMVRADPLQDTVQRAIGYTTEVQTNEALRISSALEMIINATKAPDAEGPLMTVPGPFASDRSLIDLDSIQRGDENLEQLIPWLEARISPIKEFISISQRHGLEGFGVLSSLEELVTGVTEGDIKSGGVASILTAMIHNSELLFETSKREAIREINEGQYLWMLDPKIYDVGRTNQKGLQDVGPLIDEAISLYRQMIVLENRNSIVGNLPFSLAAESMAYDLSMGIQSPSEELLMNPEDAFIQRLKESGEWDGFSIDNPELTRSAYVARTTELLTRLGLDVDATSPEFSDTANWMKDGKLYVLDIETDLQHSRVVAIASLDTQTGERSHGVRDKELTKKEALDILKNLEQKINEGYKIVTYNGIGFDLRVLGKLAGNTKLASRVAARSVDLMTNIMSWNNRTSSRGLKLDTVSEALGGKGKTEESGALAILLWERSKGVTVSRTHVDERGGFDDQIEEINKLTPEKARERLENYNNRDIGLTADLFKKLQEANSLVINGESLDVGALVPAWAEGQNTATWGTRLDRNFRDKEWRNIHDVIESIFGENALPEDTSGFIRELKVLFPNVAESELKEKLATVALYRAIQSQEARNKISRVYGLSSPHPVQDGAPVPLRHRILDKSYARTTETMVEFGGEQEGLVREDFQNVARQIGRLEKKKRVDGHQSRLLRTMVLNLYATNPLLIQDVSFDIDARTFEGGKDSHGKYFVRFGPDLRDVSSHQFSALELFAHEITHVARIKFIKDHGAEWNSFKYLMESGSGKSYIKKLVLAWHGGQWTSEARAEYRKYITNTEEFIAGLGSYHLLQDLLPEISNLTNEEAGAKARSSSIIERMMGFVHGLFLDLSHVWQKITENRKDVADLMSRLFGLDPLTKLRLPDVGNPSQSYRYGGHQPRFKGDEASKVLDKDKYIEMAGRLEQLEGIEVLSSQQEGERRFLSDELAVIGQTKLTRKTYYGKYDEYLREISSDDKISMLDFSRLFTMTGNETNAAIQEKIQWVGQYMLDLMAESRGNEMQRGAARIARGAGEILNKVLPGNVDIPKLAHTGVSGHTGSEFTMGSNLLISRWLTNLIDGNLNVFEGGLSTTEGVHSLTSALKSAALVQSGIVSKQHNITRIVRGPIITAVMGKGSTVLMSEDSQTIETSSWGAWAKLVEEGGSEVQHTEKAADLLQQNFTDKQVSEINGLILDMAKQMKAFMQSIVADKQELGEWTETNIETPLMGYLLAKDIKNDDINLNFTTTMSERFMEAVENEGSDGRIQPHFLFTAKTNEGHYLFPRTDKIEHLKEDLLTQEGEPRLPVMFDFLMTEVWKIENREKLGVKERRIGVPVSENLNIFRMSFLGDLKKANPRHRASINAAVARTYTAMSNGTFTWTTLRNFERKSGEVNNLINAYSNNINRVSNMETNVQDHNHRLQTLLVVTKDGMRASERFRSAMAFIPGKGKNPLSLHENLMKGTEYNNALHMMAMNFVQRAYAGHYLARDAWWVPRIQDVVLDKGIRKGLTLNPDKVLTNLKRGLFDEVAEQRILESQFKIKGTFQDVLNLFSEIAQNDFLRDFGGNELTQSQRNGFRSTMKFLQEKYDFMRGFQKDESNYGSMANWAYEMAPGITKLAFAGNLGLASLTVEHITNTLITMFGEGRIIDGIRTFFTPLTAGLQGESLRLMAEDHLDMIESITQAPFADYDAVASDHEPGAMINIVNTFADLALRIPKYTLRATISARVMTARKAMYKLAVKREDKFIAYVDELNDTQPATIKAKKALMNKHGISWIRYGKLLEYYRLAGLLHSSRVFDLVQAMKKSSQKDKFFVLNNLLGKIAIEEEGAGSSREYKNMLDIAGGVKTAEAQYIYESMVEPNVFDMYTGTDMRSRAWETFRRFPVLWANQMMFRKGAKASVTAWAGTIITMILLDIIYMMLLRLATGTSTDDLLEDLEERGVSGFIQTYGARLPIWGRYYGVIAAGMAAMAGGKDTPNGFIPGSAAINVVKNSVALATGWFREGGISDQDMINATRIIPMVGDSFVRLGVYGAWGNMIEKRNQNSGGGRSSGLNLKQQYNFQHMGLPDEFRMDSYEARLGRLFEEFGLEPNWPKYERQFSSPLGIPSPRAQRDARSHILPAEEQQVPQPSEEPSVPVASSQAPSGQARSTDLVASIEEQPEKLEMPEGLG